jgi:hypothetical protein
MKKILILCIVAFMFSSCIVRNRISCPAIDRTHFFKIMGVKPTKQFRQHIDGGSNRSLRIYQRRIRG